MGVPLDAKNSLGDTALTLAGKQEVFRFRSGWEGGTGKITEDFPYETRATDALREAMGLPKQTPVRPNPLPPAFAQAAR